MPSKQIPTAYERWLWIELIGFDIEEPDFGISDFFRRTGFVPTGITLLLSDPEFVHGHTGDDQQVLRPSICSYGAHPRNEERLIQIWTTGELKRLIRLLQEKGIRVFFTHFDAPVDAEASRFPEICFINKAGARLDFLCPYKRFNDGTFYRNWYLPRMVQVVRDYGFDGYHAGDGFAHPRIPIYEGDFSDDTVGLFLLQSGVSLPDTLSEKADDFPAALSLRAQWIWEHHRIQLIEFQRQRTLEFWKQAADFLHAAGKLLYMNSCWTRDPFEALYRYGVDYAGLSTAGVDGFFAETAAAAHEYGGDLPYREEGHDHWDPSRVLSRFATKLLLLRAAVPDKPILFMNGIKDTNEAWCGIRHAPTNVESEILIYTGLYHVSPEGRILRSATGPLCTLSDGLAAHEWNWIRDRWHLGYSWQPEQLLAPAIYWSNTYPEKLVEAYAKSRTTPFDRIVSKLMTHGAPLIATIGKEAIEEWRGPILVIHPQLLSSDEWAALQDYSGGPLIVIGAHRPMTTEPSLRIASASEEALELCLYNTTQALPPAPTFKDAPPFFPQKATDPFQWLDDLPSPPVDEAFYHYAAECINSISQGIRVLINRDDIRAWGYLTAPDRLRIHVRNDGFYYRTAEIDTGRDVGAIETLTAFPGNPVKPEGSRLRFKIAGKSMAVFEVQLTASA